MLAWSYSCSLGLRDKMDCRTIPTEYLR